MAGRRGKLLREAGVNVSGEVRISGGGAKGALWRQIVEYQRLYPALRHTFHALGAD